jgi:SAM-dependent methyltransferase
MSQYASREMVVRTQSDGLRAGSQTFGLKRPQYVLRYVQVSDCPACGRQGTLVDSLNRGLYRFGPFDIPYPSIGCIPIQRCSSCSLLYKGVVPDCADLHRLYAEVAAHVRPAHRYCYRFEREYVVRFAGDRPALDILDVGSRNGGLLRAFDGIPGRRSALDATPNESCTRQISGEYILQSLEDPLQWSGEPYDVVLAFDVMEHRHRAGTALSNLAMLTRPGGILVIQTADAGFVRTSSGLRRWWYLNHLDHHMAWTPESLARAAKRAGFRFEHSEIGRHKDTKYMPVWKRAGACLFRALRHVPVAVPVAVALTSHDPRLVCEPGSDDHFTAVLRRQ